MRTDAELSQIALDFVSDCTTPQGAFEYAAELSILGMRGARIPAVRADKWRSVIDALIADGKLVESSGVVLVVVEPSSDFEQLSLF